MNSLQELEAKIVALERKIQNFEDMVPDYLVNEKKFECYSALNCQLTILLKERQSRIEVLQEQQSQVATTSVRTIQLPLPQEHAPVLVSFKMLLLQVNGNLTTLSAHKGFRNYVKARADEIGVTGFIQRHHDWNIKIDFEGTHSQVDSFYDFLEQCEDQGMIQSFADVQYFEGVQKRRYYNKFAILDDHSKTVIKGEHSGNEHDYRTKPSDNREVLFSRSGSFRSGSNF